MKTNKLLLWYWVVIISLFFVSCTNKSQKTIRIGILDGPSAVSFIQMIDQPQTIGGMKTEIFIKSEPMQIQAMMMQGELDFAILPTVMAANLFNKGLKYKMVACPIWGTLYLLGSQLSKDISTLNGQTISVFGQATTSDILLRRLIQKNGISGVKIDYKYSTNHELAQAFLNKKVKLAVISEPLVSHILSQDSNIHIIEKIECEEFVSKVEKDIFVQTSFAVSDRFSKEYPSLVEHVSDAYASSCDFTNNQPEIAAQLLVSHKFSSNINIARRSIPLCSIRYMEAYVLESELNQYLHIFYDYDPKSIGGKVPEDDFIYQFY